MPGREDSELKAMAARAQAFQQRYLSTRSKVGLCVALQLLRSSCMDRVSRLRAQVLYMRRALVEYSALFGPGTMERFVRGLDTSRLSQLSYVLEQLKGAG